MKQKILIFFQKWMENHWGKFLVVSAWLLYGLVLMSLFTGRGNSFSFVVERLEALPLVILLLMVMVLGVVTWLVARFGYYAWTDGKAPLPFMKMFERIG